MLFSIGGGVIMPVGKDSQKPAQEQTSQPGKESEMTPQPQFESAHYQGSNKLLNKVAIITGGDSGIGRAVAVYYAIEGADVVITYLDEHEDADDTQKMIESKGRQCLKLAGDVATTSFCQKIVDETINKFKKIDIIVNNAAQQYPQNDFQNITPEQLEQTFRVNVFSYFYLIRSALPYLKKGSCIINSTSVTAYKGSEHLIDYSATKGAIVSLTRSLSQNLIEKGIRVNGVAPGPIWTPLIPASFTADHVEKFGSQVPMNRAGEPKEVAPCYVFLASEDSSYMAGQILHPNGGVIVNG